MTKENERSIQVDATKNTRTERNKRYEMGRKEEFNEKKISVWAPDREEDKESVREFAARLCRKRRREMRKRGKKND